MKEPAAREAKIAEMRGVGDQIATLDREVAEVERDWQLQMLLAPNLPHPDVPTGTTEHDNVVMTGFGSKLATGTFTDPFTNVAHTYDVYATTANPAIKVAIEQNLDVS